MGNYNIKVYEYADGIQIRLYNQPITSYEKVLPVPLAKPYESNELKKVHTSELSCNPLHGHTTIVTSTVVLSSAGFARSS